MPFFLFIFGITCYDFHQGQAQKKLNVDYCVKTIIYFCRIDSSISINFSKVMISIFLSNKVKRNPEHLK